MKPRHFMWYSSCSVSYFTNIYFSTNLASILVQMDIGSKIAQPAHHVIPVVPFANLLLPTALVVLNLDRIKHTSIVHSASSLVPMQHFPQLILISALTVILSVRFVQVQLIVNAVLVHHLE